MSQHMYRLVAALMPKAAPPPSISMVHNPSSVAVSGGVANFAACALGADAADRWIYLALTVEANADITAVTLDGQACSLVVASGRSTASTPDTGAWIYRVAYTAGTSKTVAVSVSSGNVALTVFRVVGGNATVVDTKASSGSGTDFQATFSVSPPADSITIAVGGISPAAADAINNVTETSDKAVGSDEHISGVRTDAAAPGALTVNIASTGQTECLCACVVT